MDIRNPEGYMDIVSYQAVKNIDRRSAEKPPFLPLVYICAPYSGNISDNIKKASEFAEYAYQQGNIPVTPHLLFPFLNDSDPKDRRVAIHMDIVVMGKCKEVWVLGDRITYGMAVELERAKRRRQTIRYFTNDFQEVRHYEGSCDSLR